MTQPTKQLTEETIDKTVRILYMVRIFFILLLAMMAPALYFLNVISDDMIIWVSIVFAFMAVSDWFVIGHIIKRLESAREQIR